MIRLRDVKAGDTVMVGSMARGPENARWSEATVAKVGRTLVHVGSSWVQKFYRETGYESRPASAIGYADVCMTHDEWAEDERRKTAIKRFLETGVTGVWGGRSWSRLPADVLDAMSMIVEDYWASQA